MRPTPGRFWAVLGVAALLLAACGDDGGEGSSASTASDGTTTSTSQVVDDGVAGAEPRDDVELVCAGGPFTVDDLASQDGVNDGVETTDDTQLGATLRQLLEDAESGGRDVPDRGWRELSTDETDDYTIHELAYGSPPDMWVATVVELGSGGRWQGELVEPCTPAPYLGGDLAGYWWPDDPDEIGPDTESLVVLVQEESCDSGRGPDGRVGDPVIAYGADAVVVTFPVTPRAGDEELTCEGHPPAEVVLELDEPLGDRELLDGATYPAREPTTEPPLHVGGIDAAGSDTA